MSLVTIPIPNTNLKAEIEYNNFTIRLLDADTNERQLTVHITGCQIGTACVKDLHGQTFTKEAFKAIKHVLKQHNFKAALEDRLKKNGSFRTKLRRSNRQAQTTATKIRR